jgi:hypothetical protein
VVKKEPAPDPVIEYDYSILDELFGFLEVSDFNSTEPILCGYFFKVVQSLLGKLKTKVLNYLLLTRGGDVFSKLLNGMMHHSLAQLLVELL